MLLVLLSKNLIKLSPGFHTEGGGGGGGGGGLEFPPPSHNFPPPPPPPQKILKLSMVIIISYLHVTEHMCHQNVCKFCPRLRQKQSERYINSKFSWGACPQTPLVGMHAFCTLLSSCYHPVSPPPNSNSCMKPWSPCSSCALPGHSNVVQLLLEHGAIVGSTDHHSSTALHLACQKGHQKCAVREGMLLMFLF